MLKWLIPIVAVIVIVGVMSGGEKFYGLSADQVQKITVSCQSRYSDDVVITERSEIAKIIKYLKSLKTFKVSVYSVGSGGGVYNLEIVKTDKTTSEIVLGNDFIKIDGGTRYMIANSQLDAFDTLIDQISKKTDMLPAR